MKAITIRCPDCRAQMKANRGLIECRYCGASVLVEGGPGADDANARVAQAVPSGEAGEQQRFSRGVIVFVTIVLLFVTLLVGHMISEENRVAEQFRARARSTAPVPVPARSIDDDDDARQAAPLRTFEWEAPHPLVSDINGDGVDDAVGFGKESGKSYHLAIFSGVDGQKLWMTDVIPGLESGADPRIFLGSESGNNVVLASGPTGDVTCYSTKDGGTMWTLKMAEVVERVGSRGPKTLIMELADESLVQMDLERGTIQPLDATDEAATQWFPMTGETMHRLGVTFAEPFSIWGTPVPKRDAFEGIDWTYAAVSPAKNFSVAVGRRDKGTGIPMVVRYELAELEPGSRSSPPLTELWRTTVAGVEPLKSRLSRGFPKAFHADESFCCVGYERQDGRPARIARFACFNMSDGTRTFDQEIPGAAVVDSISVVGKRVYLVTWSGLTVYDGATGAVLYSISG